MIYYIHLEENKNESNQCTLINSYYKLPTKSMCTNNIIHRRSKKTHQHADTNNAFNITGLRS